MMKPKSVVLFVVLAALPILAVGLCMDDFFHRAALARPAGGVFPSWHSLYDFTAGSAESSVALQRIGWLPWWTHEALSIRFLRPLASATVALDVALFGSGALGPHVHSLLWFFGALLGAHRFLKALVGERVALTSALVFGVAAYHAGPLSWLAARHVFVAGTFGFWALAFAAEGLDAAALALTVLALGASETGLSVFPMLLAVPRLRGKAIAPYVGLGALYVVIYKLGHFGARHSGVYLDPSHDPVAFLATAPVRLGAVVQNALIGLPCDTLFLKPEDGPALAVMGLIAFALVAYACKRWLTAEVLGPVVAVALASFACVGLSISGPPGGRALAFAGIGAALAFGALLESGAPKGVTRTIIGFALVFGPLMRTAHVKGFAVTVREQAPLLTESVPCAEQEPVLLLQANDMGVGMYFGIAQQLGGKLGPDRDVRVASMSPKDLVATRDQDGALRLHTADGSPIFGAVVERLYTDAPPTAPVAAKGYTLELAGNDIVARGDLASVCLLESTADRATAFSRVALPAPGESHAIPRTVGPLAMSLK